MKDAKKIGFFWPMKLATSPESPTLVDGAQLNPFWIVGMFWGFEKQRWNI